MPGCTSSSPLASSGPRWPQSHRTMSGSPSSRSGWTPIARATWTSRTACVTGRLLLTEDANTIRATNNAIFNDIFWVHLAYITAEDGIEHLRALLQEERHYVPVLAGFEAIDQGRRALEDGRAPAKAGQRADDLIWEGNIELLDHEQRAVVQPNFDRLSRIRLARLDRLDHELRGARSAAGDCVLHLVLPLLVHTRNPARCARTSVADDHPLRRPLALAHSKRRSTLPAIRRRHALGRRQPATHLRRSARLRVGPASYRLHSQTGHGELGNPGHGASHDPRIARPLPASGAAAPALWAPGGARLGGAVVNQPAFLTVGGQPVPVTSRWAGSGFALPWAGRACGQQAVQGEERGLRSVSRGLPWCWRTP